MIFLYFGLMRLREIKNAKGFLRYFGKVSGMSMRICMMFSLVAIFTDGKAKLYHQATGNKKPPLILPQTVFL
jgi:hypothetical protein